MHKIDKRRFLVGIALLLLGSDAALSLDFHHDLGSVPFFVVGALLLSFSKETWGKRLKEVTPDVIDDLFYYPILPYFQTGIAALIFILPLFLIPDYLGMIMVWLGLVVSQGFLMAFKKNIRDRMKMLAVMKFHLFLFLSTFFYVKAEALYLSRNMPGQLPPILVLTAWMIMILHTYLSLRS